MAYLVITFDKQEVDRRDLHGPIVVGRASDCDVPVRDILLSRRHCRIEPGPTGWQAVDLDSRNGTTLNGDPLKEPRTLSAGNILRLGRVAVRFERGCLANAELDPICAASQRPADPNESMAGTIAGFTLLEPGEGRTQSSEHLPLPRPEPRTPAAYQREDVYSLLSTIASSSWDSIYAQAKQPLRPDKSSALQEEPNPRARPRSPIDLSLQVVQSRENQLETPPEKRKEDDLATPKAAAPALVSDLFPRIVSKGENAAPDWNHIGRRLPAAAILIWASTIGALVIKNSRSPMATFATPPAAIARTVDVKAGSPEKLDSANDSRPDFKLSREHLSTALTALRLLAPIVCTMP